MLVREFFGVNRTKGQIGLEVEVEGNNLPRNHKLADYFNFEYDGSLRGADSCEYVFNKPYDLKEAIEIIELLENELNEGGVTFEHSFRAGVHVHLNMQEYTTRQMMTFVVAYYIFEIILTDFCGKTRVGNHFCLRAVDAEDVINYVVRFINNPQHNPLNVNDIRYAALNFASLYRYGSLEFRAMETPEDLSKISLWCKILLQILEKSLEYNSPDEIVTDFSARGIENFTTHFLGEFEEVLHNGPTFRHNIQQGMRIAQEVAYSTSWNNSNTNIFYRGL